MRPLLPMGSYSLTYPYVTSNTPAFGRTATPARVRSPMHTDRVQDATPHRFFAPAFAAPLGGLAKS